jgi:hypothetical protein
VKRGRKRLRKSSSNGNDDEKKEEFMSLGRSIKTIVTDSHFLVPFFVLVAGVVLLVVLH